MKIRIAKSAGFCFGVKRAIDIALKTAASDTNVTMLGDIVHNEDVVRQIQRAGIKKIKTLGHGRGKTLLVPAHGTTPQVLAKAKRSGYRLADATCPMVKEIHKIVREAEKRGYSLIVIGDKEHDEVRGIVGQYKKKALVIEDIKTIPWEKIRRLKKVCVVVQSTQDLEKVSQIVEQLKCCVPQVEFFNTICKPTQWRQEEIRRMPLEHDVMIVIGSKTSANTRRLYEISKSLNRRSYWITSHRQIRKNWFKNARRVGIAAGASTPAATTQKVLNRIQGIGSRLEQF